MLFGPQHSLEYISLCSTKERTVWNGMRVSKWWQNLNYLFKIWSFRSYPLFSSQHVFSCLFFHNCSCLQTLHCVVILNMSSKKGFFFFKCSILFCRIFLLDVHLLISSSLDMTFIFHWQYSELKLCPEELTSS